MSEIEQLIEQIDTALTEERYRPGGWQRLVTEVNKLPVAERVELSDRISSLGNKLHQRHGFLQLGFPLAFGAEIFLAVCGLALLLEGVGLPLVITGLVFLLLSLQPLIKIVVGLIIGVRYAYAYLWYIEPRFKMQYGSYLTTAPMERVMLHLSGGLGAPLALLLGVIFIADSTLVDLCWIFFWVMLLIQIVAFVAEWVGITKVGPLRLSLLTSPATAAMELKTVLNLRRK